MKTSPESHTLSDDDEYDDDAPDPLRLPALYRSFSGPSATPVRLACARDPPPPPPLPRQTAFL